MSTCALSHLIQNKFQLLSSFQVFFLVSYVPIHHTKTSFMWLDLCIIDESDKLVSYNQQNVSFLSAHQLINITYKVRIERFCRRIIKIRDFRSFDKRSFLEELDVYDWDVLYKTENIEVKGEDSQ